MAKRFHDTDIWEQDWFVALPSKYKFLWLFIKDKCDDSGVWRPNKELLQRIIGEPLNLNEFLVYVNNDEKERILILPNGRWFLKEYFLFQYGDSFNPHSPVHRGVLKRLVNNNIHINELSKVYIGNLSHVDNQILKQIAYEYPKDSLIKDYGYPINRVKDKDKDNKKESVRENKIHGISFINGTKVKLSDNSIQELGERQIEFVRSGDYKAENIIKGIIF